MVWEPHNPLPVEFTVDEIVKEFGGRRVTEYVGKSPNFDNADYIFPEQQVVIELKEIKKDFWNNEVIKQKNFNIAKSYLELGKINLDMIFGRALWPREYKSELVRLFRQPISRILKKCNKQIRETKKYFGYKNNRGAILFVNDFFTSLEPFYVIDLACNLLQTSYSSIDCFVYLTVNRYVELPNNDYANLLWAPIYSDRASNELFNFINDFGRHWFKYLERVIGPWDNKLETKDGDIIIGSKSIKHDI
jgi:hypothetical protein